MWTTGKVREYAAKTLPEPEVVPMPDTDTRRWFDRLLDRYAPALGVIGVSGLLIVYGMGIPI